MGRHGWTYDANFSRIDDKNASLSFKKGRSPCGISLSNIFDRDITSVTIAGGGMNWTRVRGARAIADPAVAAVANTKNNGARASAKPAPQPAKAPPSTAPRRTR
jgi:hypothetical protein